MSIPMKLRKGLPFERLPSDLSSHQALVVFAGSSHDEEERVRYETRFSFHREIVLLPKDLRDEGDSVAHRTKSLMTWLEEARKGNSAELVHLVVKDAAIPFGINWALLCPLSFSSLTLIAEHEWQDEQGLFRTFLRPWERKHLPAIVPPCHLVAKRGDRSRALLDLATVKQSELESFPTRSGLWAAIFQFQSDYQPSFPVGAEIRKVLVTGATGFLGSHIVKGLVEKGYETVVFARNASKAKKVLGDVFDKIHLRLGQMLDAQSMLRALEGVDAVIHAAAFVDDWAPKETFRTVNVTGTEKLLESCAKQRIKQFVHASSLGIYGDTDQDNVSEDTMLALSADNYSNSKIFSEILVRNFCTKRNIPFSIVRPGFIYGEGDNNFFPRVIENLDNRRFKYIGDGQNYLNLVYVGNVVNLILATIGCPECFGETYNIADRESVTLKAFVDEVAQHLGYQVPTQHIPKWIALALGMLEPVYRALKIRRPPPLTRKKITFLIRSRRIASHKAYELLGGPPYTYEEGMAKTLSWFRREKQ